MRDARFVKHKRIAAGVMAVAMLFTVLFSVFYIAAEADHECAGDGCAICACIRQCENLLRQLGGGSPTQATATFPAVFILLPALIFIRNRARETPVSAKVRLNH